MKKIKFIKSPVGAYGLSYSEGKEAEFEATQANELIENGFAIEIESEIEIADKVQPKDIKKAVKK